MKNLPSSFFKAIILTSALSMCTAAYANIEKELQYSSEVSSGNKIYFSGDNASITIVKGDSNEVVYDVKMVYKKDNKEKAEETFDKVEWTFTEGSEIRLKEKIKKHEKAKHLDIYVTITLPDEHPLDVGTVNGDIKTEDNFQTDVTVTNVNGDIKLEGNIGGSLDAHNVNGRVKAVDVSDSCYAKSVNGNIRLGSIGGNLDIQNVNGQTEVGEVRSNVTGNSVNGKISLTLAKEITTSVNLKSVNGNLEVTCPESLGVTLVAKSNNGSLSCDKTLKITKIKKNKIEGTSGDGSVNVKLKSVNGNVTIETY